MICEKGKKRSRKIGPSLVGIGFIRLSLIDYLLPKKNSMMLDQMLLAKLTYNLFLVKVPLMNPKAFEWPSQNEDLYLANLLS